MRNLRAASSEVFDRPSSVIVFLAVITAPFILLFAGGRESNNVPWYLVLMGFLLLLILLVAGFFMFRHESHSAEEVSIRPKNR
jgi:RsiW-degrading membrane proteinase PrsW (M82 family)